MKVKQAAKDKKLDEFFKAQDCTATMEEIKEFFSQKKGELFEEDLENVAGGSIPLPLHGKYEKIK